MTDTLHDLPSISNGIVQQKETRGKGVPLWENERRLRHFDGVFWRVIRSAHLFRPEHYLTIAHHLATLDPAIPYAILAFFPVYQLSQVPSPTLAQMLDAYQVVREVGLANVKLGNCGRLAQASEEWEALLAVVRPEAIA